MFELIVGALILALDIWAILKIIESSASTAAKTVWILVIFFLPVIGLIAWFFAGPRGSSAAHA